MKKAVIVALSCACLAGTGYAEWLVEGQQSLRLDYVYADDSGSESANGVEIGFGTALYELDDVAVYFMHLENDDMEAQQLGVSVQQHFPWPSGIPIIPYAGAAMGYGWLDVDGSGVVADDPDKGGFLARVEMGLLYKFCDYSALNAGVRLNFSTHDIFLDDDGSTEDTMWTFVLGGRIYY